MKKPHGNALRNSKPHHLYEIEDTQEKDIFKYGISADPIGEDGLSKRLRRQLNFMNLVAGFVRFVGSILLHNIEGRQKAIELEDEHIDSYFEKHGRNTRGNLQGGKRNRRK